MGSYKVAKYLARAIEIVTEEPGLNKTEIRKTADWSAGLTKAVLDYGLELKKLERREDAALELYYPYGEVPRNWLDLYLLRDKALLEIVIAVIRYPRRPARLYRELLEMPRSSYKNRLERLFALGAVTMLKGGVLDVVMAPTGQLYFSEAFRRLVRPESYE